MNIRQLLLLLFVLMLSGQLLASANISISPSTPIANETFNITVKDTFRNGCVPTEIFSIRLKSNNIIEIVASPSTQDICTQALTDYEVSRNHSISVPGNYTLKYFVGFNTESLGSKQITVLPDPDETDNGDDYTNGWKDSALNCLFKPESCGIGDSSASLQGSEFHIPVLKVPGLFGVSVNKYYVVLEIVPFSDPVSFKLKSIKLLDEAEEE